MITETYTVKRRDTLSKIADQHGVSVDDIARANHIADINKIAVGQVLKIPKPANPQTAQESDSSWSETLLSFLDSLGRPIVGLAVRLVSGDAEVHAMTDAGGRIPAVKGKTKDEIIAVHVKKHIARGGGEKQIASYTPMPGKQSVRVQSGMHVETTKMRQHNGTPDQPPGILKPTSTHEKTETRTPTGAPVTCSVGCECPNPDDIKLDANNVYRDWVKQAAKRADLMPQAVAAAMNAEAAKEKGGKWKADSKSPKSSATGMTQFLDATWIGEALRGGTYLHDKCKQEEWLSKDEKGRWRFKKADGAYIAGPNLMGKLRKLLTSRRSASDKNLQKLLNLREEPEFAIMAAMDYAKTNLDSLSSKGYTINDLNDTEKARIMYLCHHLGLADAVHFIQNTLPEEDVTGTNKNGKKVVRQNGAKKLLITQIGEKRALKEFVDPNGGSWVKGHRVWLNEFENVHVIPSMFACPGNKRDQLQDEEDKRKGALLKITEKLNK